jgi:hypothetical protein
MRLPRPCGADAISPRDAAASGWISLHLTIFKSPKQNLRGIVVQGGRIEVREILEIVERRERKLLANMGDL